MAIGSGIFLIVVGAILTFALNASVVNLGAVGWICMIAGAAAIVISLVMSNQARNTTHTEIRDENVDEHRVEHHAR